MSPAPTLPSPWAERWQRLSAAFLRAFHRYANWLVGISWKRFIALSIALLIVAAILSELPPFSWRVTETIEDSGRASAPPAPPAPPKPPSKPTGSTQIIIGGKPVFQIDKPASGSNGGDGVDISIDDRGIRVRSRGKAAAAAVVASAAASAAAPAAALASPASAAGDDDTEVHITLPKGVNPEALREAVAEAKLAVEEAIRSKREAAEEAAQAAREAEQAAREAEREAREAIAEAGKTVISPSGRIKRTRKIHWGDFLTDLALIWILASAIIKGTYKGRIQAEVKAAQAAETAEAESLKRQVVEARMAAMQAQVEPHFLFNTLASIDHLIETDPQRASQMQKNLIALLRASMPTMREANADGAGGGLRDLARELQVIRPYLEILKVRMEERLATQIDVPDGLLSAEFPPMMLQTLVENAIKHGLEPKAEGGTLAVKAEIVHGKLQVTVADTGLGFGKAATAGTGVGLANIRERLQLLYGPKASLTIAENPGGGTRVSITVPYRSVATETA
ncbi:MAG: sensor histidine kinase [Rubrivivax sp.]